MKNTVLNMMGDIFGNEFQPSLRDWWLCASTPALKRRAIVGLSRLGRIKADISRAREKSFALRLA